VGRIALLERGGAALRRVGLGGVVDAVARRFGSRLSRFELEVDGLRLGGDRLGHLYYARELVADDRESYFRELFVDSIRAGGAVLEGGPYIGFLTISAARAVGASGRVVAVEPSPETIATLRANVARNGFDDRVTVVEAALGAEPGRATFHVTEGGDTSSLHAPPSAARTVEVEIVRGDDLLDAVDVVKLDLEGNEVDALRGLRETIGRTRPVIFCECNAAMLEAAGASADELLRELAALGYDVRWIDEATRTLRPADEPWEDGYVNLRCAPA
ncbi:MAG TPA: FkbM family methyltransferase, partial [Gaiellaceae bacterium]